MHALTEPLLAAFLSLQPLPQVERSDIALPPPIMAPAPVQVMDKPLMDLPRVEFFVPDERPVKYLETTESGIAIKQWSFDLFQVNLVVQCEEQLKQAGWHLGHLYGRYGDDLQLMSSMGYYCMRSGQSSGRVIVDGNMVASGTTSKGVYLIYQDRRLKVSRTIPKDLGYGEWAHGGLALLVQEGQACDPKELRSRDIGYYETRDRCSLLVYDDGTAAVSICEATLAQEARIHARQNVKWAVTFDSGNSRTVAWRDHAVDDSMPVEQKYAVRRTDHYRRLKSVLGVVRRS